LFYVKHWKNITRLVNIVWLLLLSGMVQAASVTATIESYKSASLSGDVPQTMTVSFVNNGGTKGQVGADGSATLTLSNWPDATMQSITLYMHSNQSSGAATVSLSVNDSAWQVAKGAYSLWPGTGGYSKEDLPISAMKRATHISRGSSLKLQINGTANSVFLQKMVVEYTLTPPVPHTVTLQYPSNGGAKQMQLTEPEAEAGVELPSVPTQDSVLTDQGEIWYWVGWSEQSVSMQSTMPLCWQSGDWYGPDDDVTLYALYTNSPTQILHQDSSCTSGEYAMAFEFDEQLRALSGQWESGQIRLRSVSIEQDADGRLFWQLDTLSAQYRYFLQFVADSVTIQHVATGAWIGYSSKSGASRRCKWAWRRATDGSVYFYNQLTPLADPYCLTVLVDEPSRSAYAAYQAEPYISNFPYWRLFPTSAVPTQNKAKYSSLPTYVALPTVPVSQTSATKVLDKNGSILIRHQNKMYTVLGNLQL